MKINSILLILVAFTSIHCSNTSTKKEAAKKSLATPSKATAQNVYRSKGYELIKQKCFICHLETPNPSMKNQMIAPPMVRVQEHYKPAYPDRQAFAKAVMSYVKNPSEAKTLMPGAVNRFKLMPKLNYDDHDLLLIAETLHDIDFKTSPKMNMQITGGLKLNNGQKWKLKPASMGKIKATVTELNNLHTASLTDYHKLGKDIFATTKAIMLDKSYEAEVYNQLQLFFHGIEDNMHTLMAAESVAKAKKQVSVLKDKFKSFYYYFE